MPQIHQALHGYQRGHRLLAASMDLPPEAQRLMTIASDLSGPGRTQGFESYLTGYPLTSEGLYVLARTWYADDAPRPGCVWTHSLLVRTADLAGLKHLGVLASLFQLPNDGLVDAYRRPLELSDSKHTPAPSGSPDMASVAKSLLQGLYCQPQATIVFASRSSSIVEDAVLAVWSQQWPRLRRAFTFSTGSLSDRRQTTGMRFDVQVVPADRLQRVLRSHPDNATVDQDRTPEERDVVAFLASELAQPDQTFRSYLQAAGADVRDCRQAAVPLVRVYRSAASAPSLAALMREVSTGFPDSTALHLRRMLLGPAPKGGSWSAQIGEAERLEYLATSASPSDYEAGILELVARGRNLLATDRPGARALTSRLLAGDPNPQGAALLGGFAEAWTLDDIVDLEGNSAGAAAAIVYASPGVATSPEFWEKLGGVREELVEAISSSPALDEQIAVQVLCAVLAADANPPESMVARGGLPFVSALLDAAGGELKDQPLDKNVPAVWLRAFAPHIDAVKDWVLARRDPLNHLQLWLVATGCSTKPDHFADLTAEQWKRLLPPSLDELSGSASRAVSTFLFHVAMLAQASVAIELLQLSFPTLHRALERSKLSTDDWYRLSSVLPPAIQWRGWDHAQRLRRALAMRVVSAPGLVAIDLVTICKDSSQLEEVLEDAILAEETRILVTQLDSDSSSLDKKTRKLVARIAKELERKRQDGKKGWWFF